MWNQAHIAEGAELVADALRERKPGPYQLQAAIAAVHAHAPSSDETDWWQIVGLYTALHAAHPSPVVALNRAAALAMAAGPHVGLEALHHPSIAEPLADYHLWHAARADLLRRAGRAEEAADAYQEAIARVTNETERHYLEGRLAEVRGH